MERKKRKQLEWSLRSAEQLVEIEKFIARENPAMAAMVVDRIIATAARLSVFPQVGRVGRVRGTRELIITRYPYIVVYRVLRTKVQVVRVVHQSKKYP